MVVVPNSDVIVIFIYISKTDRLVIQAMGEGGKVLLLEMGNTVKLLELVVKIIEIIRLVPEQDIPISHIGLRPGNRGLHL